MSISPSPSDRRTRDRPGTDRTRPARRSSPRRRRRFLLTLLAAALLLWLGLEALRFNSEKAYGWDEFQYAHGAWKIARGEVIYRDFFEHHFPLVHQLLALVWLGLDDNPLNIAVLRQAMLPFLALIVLAAALLNRRWSRGAGWVTALVLLATVNIQTLATEIRPDPVALAFFLAALAVLGSRRLSRWTRGGISGLLLTLSVWGSQKVLYYGLVFPAAFVVDLIRLRRAATRQAPARRGHRPGYLLGHPVAFALGSSVVLAGIAVYLWVTGSFGDWFFWCLRWSFVHQEKYPDISWVTNFEGYLQLHLWLFPFAGLGVWRTIHRLRRRRDVASPADASPDVLLLGSLVTTAASFVWQTAPYYYSLLPWTAVSSVFAARGLIWSFRALRALTRRRPAVGGFGTALLVLLLVGELSHTRTALSRVLETDNAPQRRMLGEIAAMTTVEDPVYNITGNQVSRPDVHFFYFTDAVIRKLFADRLAEEIPAAILAKGCTVYTHDPRFSGLPKTLQAFLLDRFQPVSRDLWIWGQRYVPQNGALEDTFLAVRNSGYYVEPETALGTGELWIDGRPVSGPVIDLARGLHSVQYRGDARELYLVWLPRDGERRPIIVRPLQGPAVVPGGRGIPEIPPPEHPAPENPSPENPVRP